MRHAYIHLVVLDLSVPTEDPRHADYVSVPDCYDLAGYVTSLAQRNQSEVGKIRMHFFPKKSSWDAAKRHYYDKVCDWSLIDKPIVRVNE